MQCTQANVDALGFDVGKKVVLRCSKSQQRLTSTLEVVKFICKDFWIFVFGKQVRQARSLMRVQVDVAVGSNVRCHAASLCNPRATIAAIRCSFACPVFDRRLRMKRIPRPMSGR